MRINVLATFAWRLFEFSVAVMQATERVAQTLAYDANDDSQYLLRLL